MRFSDKPVSDKHGITVVVLAYTMHTAIQYSVARNFLVLSSVHTSLKWLFSVCPDIILCEEKEVARISEVHLNEGRQLVRNLERTKEKILLGAKQV